MEFKNVTVDAMPTDKDKLEYVNSSLNIRPDRTNGADEVALYGSSLTAETPFKVWRLKVWKGSEAHLHFKEGAKKPYPLTDISVADSNLHISSDVEIDVEEVSGYKSLDIIVSGNSNAHIDLRNFDLDSIYLCLNHISESAKVHIFVKDGVKLWVNTKGRVGAYQLRIDGLPKMEVTSM